MKKFLCLIGLTALASVESREYWQCGNPKFVCSQEQTCCQSRVQSAGWECQPVREAVCCSDGIHFCPKGTICDLINLRCNKSQLTFLTPEENSSDMTQNEMSPKPVIVVKDLVEGFFHGFDFFNQVAADNLCINNQELANEIYSLIQKIKNITFDKTFPKAIEDLVEEVLSKKEVFLKEVQECKHLTDNVRGVAQKLLARTQQPEYLKAVASHVVYNLATIKEDIEALKPLVASGDYLKLGEKLGALVKFLLFWDI